ncbi:MAG: integrase core domain-containing protein [Anaerolineae bacterium]
METEWIIARTRLWQLLQEHPEFTTAELAQQLGYCAAWVRKWRRRLRERDPNDPQRFCSVSRRPQHVQKHVSKVVEERIVHLRHTLATLYNRKVGGKTIAYYLRQQADLQGHYLPRSPSTIWRVLRRHHCILRREQHEHQLMLRSEPLQVWEVDFCDVPTATACERRQAHQVEVFNVLDRGTSLCVELHASDHYDAEYTLLTTAQLLLVHGLPRLLVCDNDPRLVGSWSSDGFPSAWMRFLSCLGVQPAPLPPHRPDQKPIVERFIRTLKEELLWKEKPTTAPETNILLPGYHWHYNHERPHQSVVCANQPPAVAFPSLPLLPRVPEQIDPDAWLQPLDGQRYKRVVDAKGAVQVNKHDYYVGKAWRGQPLSVCVDAQHQLFVLEQAGSILKRSPIKGLQHNLLDFQDYLGWMCDEARSEWAEYQRRLKQKRLKGELA